MNVHQRGTVVITGILFCGLLGLVDVASAREEAKPLVPLPSLPDFTRGGGWGVGLGVGVEYGNAYDGSDEYEFEVEPAGAVQYRWGNHLLFWEGVELGWRSRVSETWLVQLAARYEGGREADDSDDGFLDGLAERDDEVVGVLEIRYALVDDWRFWFGGRLMAGDADFGLLGVLALGWCFRVGEEGTGSEVLVFATAGDDDFLNKDFGVSAMEAAVSGLEQTDLEGGYRSVGLTVVDRRYLTSNMQLVTQAGVEFYSDNIGDSPIAREDFELELGLSVVYVF